MHEFGLTQNILSTALQQANAVQATKISQLNLIIGELSDITEESVQFYFDLLSKDSIAAGATLAFRHSPAQLRCRKCTTVFTSLQDQCTQPKEIEEPPQNLPNVPAKSSIHLDEEKSAIFQGIICPHCYERNIEIVAGHELYLESIEVE